MVWEGFFLFNRPQQVVRPHKGRLCEGQRCHGPCLHFFMSGLKEESCVKSELWLDGERDRGGWKGRWDAFGSCQLSQFVGKYRPVTLCFPQSLLLIGCSFMTHSFMSSFNEVLMCKCLKWVWSRHPVRVQIYKMKDQICSRVISVWFLFPARTCFAVFVSVLLNREDKGVFAFVTSSFQTDNGGEQTRRLSLKRLLSRDAGECLSQAWRPSADLLIVTDREIVL